MKIKYIAHVIQWWDKVNGNTYHSVSITRTDTGETVRAPFQYGYGWQYEHTTLEKLSEVGWIPKEYMDRLYLYERENDYPIKYIVHYGTKRECMEHGKTLN